MEDSKRYIAVDLGAESGRVMLSEVAGGKLTLNEIHRFENGPYESDGSLKWDFAKLFGNIKKGIAIAVKQAGGVVSGIGVDTWGVDFGLLNQNDELIEDPYHYRDSRTEGMMDKAAEVMGAENLYKNTGIQFMPFNTVYQLMSLVGSDVLVRAKKLLFMPDLISYLLCGKQYGEYTIASTSALMDMKQKTWSKEVFDKLGLPIDIMPDVVEPGTVVGKLTGEICAELGCGPIDVIAIGAHDTASAVAAVPVSKATGDNWAFLSSGTWSLMGVEIPDAVITDLSYENMLTNEGGVENSIRLLKNIMGLWVLQECRRQWKREGDDLDYSTIAKISAEAKPFVANIDPDNELFYPPGDMPARINEYLSETGQGQVEDKGQIARIILESLAFKYRVTMEKLEKISGASIDVLHIVGGGIQNELLCQFAANATGKKVVTGPIEATATGNVLMQAIACGQVASLADAREIVSNSYGVKEYLPTDAATWDIEYNKLSWK